MIIASGHVVHPLKTIAQGAASTWFLTPANPVTARKKWIAGLLEPRGALVIDAGAVRALRGGKKSSPPAGAGYGRGRGLGVATRWWCAGPDGAGSRQLAIGL